MELDIFEKFEPISLDKTNKVKMMNRIDCKYVVSGLVLNEILGDILSQYYILEINDKRVMPYISLYYDTIDNSMYMAHHNGKLNRYKIRYRKYLTNNESFLEVKYKDKGIRTIKKRIKVSDIEHAISADSAKYLSGICPFDPSDLEPKIFTNFSRITLVNKNFTERVTIDLDLHFESKDTDGFKLKNSAIIETKRDGAVGDSLIRDTLQKYGVPLSGMSKYCFGRAVTEVDIKSNRFKRKILNLNKIENGKHYYRNLPTT